MMQITRITERRRVSTWPRVSTPALDPNLGWQYRLMKFCRFD